MLPETIWKNLTRIYNTFSNLSLILYKLLLRSILKAVLQLYFLVFPPFIHRETTFVTFVCFSRRLTVPKTRPTLTKKNHFFKVDCYWMDDLRFYVLFNSVSIISGRWEVDNERLCAMELRLRLRRFRLERGSASRPLDQ